MPRTSSVLDPSIHKAPLDLLDVKSQSTEGQEPVKTRKTALCRRRMNTADVDTLGLDRSRSRARPCWSAQVAISDRPAGCLLPRMSWLKPWWSRYSWTSTRTEIDMHAKSWLADPAEPEGTESAVVAIAEGATVRTNG